MYNYGLILYASFVLVRLYCRFWLIRPFHSRPIFLRASQVLHFLEAAAFCGLIAGFFVLLPLVGIWKDIILAALLVGVDVVTRWLLLEFQIRRLMRGSEKWTREAARHHLCKRVAIIDY